MSASSGGAGSQAWSKVKDMLVVPQQRSRQPTSVPGSAHMSSHTSRQPSQVLLELPPQALKMRQQSMLADLTPKLLSIVDESNPDDVELAAVRDALVKTEEENRRLQEENKKFKSERDDYFSKLQTKIAQFTKLQHESKEIEQERDSLKSEIDFLLDEIDLLKENARIQDTNVETLKKVGEKLQEDIAKYKRKQDDIVREHHLQMLRMEAELMKDTEELTREFEEKNADLRQKVKDMKKEKNAKEAELEKDGNAQMAHMEVFKQAKAEEISKLRKKIEQLQREQIDAMRDRMKTKEQHDPSGDVPAARRKTDKKPPADLTVHTANVMSEISAGKKILSLEVISKRDDFRPAVSWQGNAPKHAADIASMDVGVQLAVDNAVLHPVPSAKYRHLPHPAQNEREWYFGTSNGAVMALALRMFASSAAPLARR
eukprot:TRINITY_DN9660_c0_g1_i2.p1 TRINITY_DN9660_c0_g1~~TRINITY_DN9660_c0_g1_i2.p1  ORF type:complete len:429 (+),score=201.32 TRINITY_DN9660_c0_g1_i2:30-1316(+)